MNFDPNDYNELTVTESPIPGLFCRQITGPRRQSRLVQRELSKRKNGSTGTAVI